MVVVADWDEAAPGTVTPDDVRATINRPSDPPAEDHVAEYTRLVATSGSTGTPKIVAMASPAVMATDETAATVLGTGVGTWYLTTSPLYHVNGWMYCYAPLLGDCRVVLMERFDGQRVVELIEKYRVHFTCMVPTMLMRVARVPDVAKYDLSSLDRVVYGGAAAPEWVIRAWLDLIPPDRFTLSYGGSENHGLVMTTGDQWLTHPGTVGQPMGTELKILDEDGNELPTGRDRRDLAALEDGGAEVPLHRPAHPEPDPEGFGTFGDLGYVDDEGFVYIADRRRDMIVTGGANVYPAEVEAVLTEHEGVLDVVVIGLPDPEWGRRVHTVVQACRRGRRAHTRRASCALQGTPRVVQGAEDLRGGRAHPRSAAGKVNRSSLINERAGR